MGQHYFFFVALFPSPFLGFPFPRSFFRRICSSLKSWCSSLNGQRKNNQPLFLPDWKNVPIQHCSFWWFWSSVPDFYRAHTHLGEQKGQGVPHKQTRCIQKFIWSQFPLTEAVSQRTVNPKASHESLGNYDTTLVITPNFPITPRLNTEMSRKWV